MTKLTFYNGYAGGGVKCEVHIGEERFVMEIEEVIESIEKVLLEKGYTTSQTNRQKYPRIHMNI